MKKKPVGRPPDLEDKDNIFKNPELLKKMTFGNEESTAELDSLVDYIKRGYEYTKGNNLSIGDAPKHLDSIIYFDQLFDQVKKGIQTTTELDGFEGFESFIDNLNEISLDKIDNPLVSDSTIYKRMKVIADKTRILIDAQKRRIKSFRKSSDTQTEKPMSEQTNRKNRNVNHIIYLLDHMGLFDFIEKHVASKMDDRGRIKATDTIISEITGIAIPSFEKYTRTLRRKDQDSKGNDKVDTKEAIEYVKTLYKSLNMGE